MHCQPAPTCRQPTRLSRGERRQRRRHDGHGRDRHPEAAARAVNLYALADVPPQRVHVALVVHGKATPLVLSDAAYRNHFDKPYPDAALIARLRAAGVELFVCGQALSHRGYRSDEVRDEVLVTLSAMTKLVELQTAGYGLIP